jgi:hypothetical protein
VERLVYTCALCDKVHEGLPAITFDAPALYYEIPEDERDERAHLSADFCVIDNEHYFVRTVLTLPIKQHAETLEWGVWGSLSTDNFKRYAETFDDDGQSKLGAMFSYFSSRLRGYPETLNETTTVHPRDGRQRPRVEFHSTSLHPLAVDQRDGISYERAIELASPALHPNEA